MDDPLPGSSAKGTFFLGFIGLGCLIGAAVLLPRAWSYAAEARGLEEMRRCSVRPAGDTFVAEWFFNLQTGSRP